MESERSLVLYIDAHTLPKWHAYRYSESAADPVYCHLVRWTYQYAELVAVNEGLVSDDTARMPLVERPPWLTPILTIAQLGGHITHVESTNIPAYNSWYVYFATDREHNLLHFGPEP